MDEVEEDFWNFIKGIGVLVFFVFVYITPLIVIGDLIVENGGKETMFTHFLGAFYAIGGISLFWKYWVKRRLGDELDDSS